MNFSAPHPVLLTGQQFSLEDDCACAESPQLFPAQQSFAGETDCACPLPPHSRNAPVQPRQRIFRQAKDVYVDDSFPSGFRLLFSSFSAQGPVMINEPAWQRWMNFAQPQPLSQSIDSSLAEHRLLCPESIVLPPLRPAIETLTAWLHVTNACNLDCPYCYVRKSSARMSEAVGLQAIRQIFNTAQKHHFKGIKLKYAGGEATLHLGLIKKLSIYARALAAQTGLTLQQVVLSNGTLLKPKDAAWLQKNNFRLMISLDGLNETHDRLRPTKNGLSSFEMVRRVIDETLLPAAFVPMITLTITQSNSSKLAETVRWVLSRNLPLSLNFYRRPGGPLQDLSAEEDDLIQGMLSAYQVYEEMLPAQPFFNGLLDRVRAGAHTHTCGVNHSYLVITHEGKVTQCQMLLRQPAQTAQSEDLLAAAKSGPLENLPVDEKNNCRDCAYRYLCAGGCPLETYRAAGRWDVPHPHCRIYKALLPKALHLEGLRLLKAHGYLS